MEISPTERKAIRKMWRKGANAKKIAAATHHGTDLIYRIVRGAKRNHCGCGRRFGHHGLCWVSSSSAGKVPTWTPEAEALLCQLWTTDASNEAVAAAISELRGREVTIGAITCRCRRLGIYRSKDFRANQRKPKTPLPAPRSKFPAPDAATARMIQDLWRAGIPRRVIAQKTGQAEWPIQLLCHGLERAQCACGRPSGHSGKCKERAEQDHTLRPAYEKWVLRNKRWTEEADNLVRTKYPTAILCSVLAAEVSELLGRSVSQLAIRARAFELDVKGRKRIVHPGFTRVRRERPTQAGAIISASNEVAKSKPPFRMMSTRGPDPYAAIRLQQIANASKGRL